MHTNTHPWVLCAERTRGSGSSDTPISVNILSVQVVISKHYSELNKPQGSLDKWLIPELGYKKYKITLKPLFVPESWKVIKEFRDMSHQKDIETSLKTTPSQIWNNTKHENK